MEEEEQKKEECDRDDRKLFVNGLKKETTPKEMRRYFEQFGRVENSRVVRNERNESKGFGFILFERKSDADQVLVKKPIHVMRVLQLKTTQYFANGINIPMLPMGHARKYYELNAE